MTWAYFTHPDVFAAAAAGASWADPAEIDWPERQAQRAALAKALAARRFCPRCGTDAGYVLPRRLGCCLACASDWERDRAA